MNEIIITILHIEIQNTVDWISRATTNRDYVGGNGFLLTQLVVVWSFYKSGHGPVGAAAAALAPIEALRLSRSRQNFFLPIPTRYSRPFLFSKT